MTARSEAMVISIMTQDGPFETIGAIIYEEGKHTLVVHAPTMHERSEHGIQWSVSHAATGFRVTTGDTVEDAAKKAIAMWQNLSTAQIASAMRKAVAAKKAVMEGLNDE